MQKDYFIKQVKKVLIIISPVLIIVLVFYGTKSIINRYNNVDKTNINNTNEQIEGVGDEIINDQINQEQESIEMSEKQQSQETDFLEVEENKSEIDYTPHPEIKIRIIKKPHGEEPDWVQEAWVDLEIPVIKGMYKQKGGQEVLSGEFRQEDNYVVPVEEALSILKQKNPAAEKWWRDNIALEEIYGIGFDRDVCELIGE